MKFNLNGVEWKIIETSQKDIKMMQNWRNANEEDNVESINDRYYGITYNDDCIIYLDEDLKKDRKRKALLHELAHCYIVSYMTHQDRGYNEEDVADIVSNSLDIIQEIANSYFKNKAKAKLNNM